MVSSESEELRLRDALARFRADRGTVQAGRWRTALVLALYAGDLARARRIANEAAGDISPTQVLDDVVAPAMRDIGALWERNEITIADEHLATSLAGQLLADVSTRLVVAPAASRETILLATPEPEQHTIGLTMAHHVLRGAGFVTIDLGAGVPAPALAAAVERHRPGVIGLSSTMPFTDALSVAATVALDAAPTAQLFVGGRGAETFPADIPARRIDRMASLLDVVNGMVGDASA